VRRWWWLSLTAFFLMGAAWAVALPVNGSYDEKDHIARAYAVATGQLTPSHEAVNRRGDLDPAFLVPASLLPVQATVDCAWSPRPPRPASCQRWSAQRHAVPTPSGAARYSPVYYLPVGIPLALWPDLTGIVLGRLVSALLLALLLAGAMGAALRLGSRPLAAGIALTATPLTMSLGASINPNGLEMGAGILVFCALLALVRAPDGRLDDRAVRRLLALACVGSLLLLTLRELGPALLALNVGTCALLARRGRLGALRRRRDARWMLGTCWVAGAVFAAGWLLYSGLAAVAPNTRDALHLSPAGALGRIARQRLPFDLKQIVGEFDYGETHLSPYVVGAWYLLVAALVVPCLWYAGRRAAVTLAGLGALSFGLLAVLDLHFLPLVGWFSQGRYALPSLVGVVLGAAAAGTRPPVALPGGGVRTDRYPAVLAAATAVLHMYALVRVMSRFQIGIAAPLDPFGGSWRAPLGPVPPLLAGLAGVSLLAAVVAFAGRRAGAPDQPAHPPLVAATGTSVPATST
jgi:hypothetical protein